MRLCHSREPAFETKKKNDFLKFLPTLTTTKMMHSMQTYTLIGPTGFFVAMVKSLAATTE